MQCTVRFPMQCMLHFPMQRDAQLHGVMYYAIVMPMYSVILPWLCTARLPSQCSTCNVQQGLPCQCTRTGDVSVVHMQHLIWDAHFSTLLMIATDHAVIIGISATYKKASSSQASFNLLAPGIIASAELRRIHPPDCTFAQNGLRHHNHTRTQNADTTWRKKIHMVSVGGVPQADLMP